MIIKGFKAITINMQRSIKAKIEKLRILKKCFRALQENYYQSKHFEGQLQAYADFHNKRFEFRRFIQRSRELVRNRAI